MSDLTITPDTVRLLLLHAQGLLHPPAQPAQKEDVLNAIRRMGVLQIDTIHVVARSPYLVLWSRLGDYNPAWLDELLAEGHLFEYWAHAACFIPREDYPLFRPRMTELGKRYFNPAWQERSREQIERVLRHIQEQGEVRSADFERTDGKPGGWWNWKEEKLILEFLHTSGELMIARRENFQRVYDLRERVHPDWNAQEALPADQAQDELSERAVRYLGAATARWTADYFRQPKSGMPARLERLVKAGRLLRVDVQGWKEPAYLHPEHLSLLEWAAGEEVFPTYTTLLSPFDPLVWDRDRARALFNFDYTIECYTPAAKRQYGYFTLPILHEGQLIGRLDAKAHRKDGIFEVKALHLEPRARPSEDVAEALSDALRRCARWHKTPEVIVRRTVPDRFAGLMAQALENPQIDGSASGD